MKIYHNPRCSKSRETLDIINGSGKKVQVINYLETPPTFEELKSIITKLGISAEQLLRKGESIYKEQFHGQSHTDTEWIRIMVANPKLIERPIVVDGDKAIIGRPPEMVRSLL